MRCLAQKPVHSFSLPDIIVWMSKLWKKKTKNDKYRDTGLIVLGVQLQLTVVPWVFFCLVCQAAPTTKQTKPRSSQNIQLSLLSARKPLTSPPHPSVPPRSVEASKDKLVVVSYLHGALPGKSWYPMLRFPFFTALSLPFFRHLLF